MVVGVETFALCHTHPPGWMRWGWGMDGSLCLSPLSLVSLPLFSLSSHSMSSYPIFSTIFPFCLLHFLHFFFHLLSTLSPPPFLPTPTILPYPQHHLPPHVWHVPVTGLGSGVTWLTCHGMWLLWPAFVLPTTLQSFLCLISVSSVISSHALISSLICNNKG